MAQALEITRLLILELELEIHVEGIGNVLFEGEGAARGPGVGAGAIAADARPLELGPDLAYVTTLPIEGTPPVGHVHNAPDGGGVHVPTLPGEIDLILGLPIGAVDAPVPRERVG